MECFALSSNKMLSHFNSLLYTGYSIRDAVYGILYTGKSVIIIGITSMQQAKGTVENFLTTVFLSFCLTFIEINPGILRFMLNKYVELRRDKWAYIPYIRCISW